VSSLADQQQPELPIVATLEIPARSFPGRNLPSLHSDIASGVDNAGEPFRVSLSLDGAALYLWRGEQEQLTEVIRMSELIRAWLRADRPAVSS
jgi:hypothetical protein